jgi:hypothetical protein
MKHPVDPSGEAMAIDVPSMVTSAGPKKTLSHVFVDPEITASIEPEAVRLNDSDSSDADAMVEADKQHETTKGRTRKFLRNRMATFPKKRMRNLRALPGRRPATPPASNRQAKKRCTSASSRVFGSGGRLARNSLP